MAVPFPKEEMPWLEELRQKFGREPTLDEIIQEMTRRGEISPDMATELGLTPEPGGNEKMKNGP